MKELQSLPGYDVVDMVPIPKRGDRLVKIRTLEEAIADFDNSDTDETITYLVKVRKNTKTETSHMDALEMPRTGIEGIYLPNGKLNNPFLLQNAELLFKQGEYALARNIYTTLLKSGEGTALALYWLGRCFEAEGKSTDAQASYEESITYHPTNDCCRRLANILVAAKKDQQAAELLESAINIKGTSKNELLELHKAAGNCWLRAEKADKAERHYRKGLELDPLADSMLANLGALYLETGKTEEAMKYFQDALAANPKNDRAMTGLGSCSLMNGDQKQAHDFFAKSLQLNLNNPTAVYYLVRCAYELKSYATATHLLSEYLQIAPLNANLLFSLAGLQYQLGRMTEARETALKTLELQHDHTGAKDLLDVCENFTNGV